MKQHDRPMTPEQIAKVKDEDINFSEVPELDSEFWHNAELVESDESVQISIRVKRSVLQFYRATGKGYQTRMNRVLESYAKSQRKR